MLIIIYIKIEENSYENKDNSYIKLGEELEIFIKSNYTKDNLIGKIWSGRTVFQDFYNPNIKEFWNKGLDDYYNLINYDRIWLDMNDPTNLLENKYSKCIWEIAEENQCSPDKNKYHNEELPYLPGYRKNVIETLSLKSISKNALIYGNNQYMIQNFCRIDIFLYGIWNLSQKII